MCRSSKRRKTDESRPVLNFNTGVSAYVTLHIRTCTHVHIHGGVCSFNSWTGSLCHLEHMSHLQGCETLRNGI